MTTFNVSGTAERYSAPERAIVHVRVSATSLNKGDAYRGVVAIHNELVAEASDFRTADVSTWFDASAPSTYSYQERWVPDGEDAEPQTRMRYAASSRVSVKFQNFEKMGEWLAELADRDFIATSVEWKLTDATQKSILKEIRSEAVANARELAEDYARGDGIDPSATRLELKSVSDNSYQHTESYASPLRGASAMKVGSAPVAAVSPEDIQLSANITALFEL